MAELGLDVGIFFDPKQHKLHLCACCENLFFDPSDQPRFCSACLKPHIHLPGGPLPEPKGVVS